MHINHIQIFCFADSLYLKIHLAVLFLSARSDTNLLVWSNFVF